MDRVEDLKKFSIFSDWSDEELGKIAPYLNEEKIEKNNILFKQNDPASKIYFVKSGCIELKITITDAEDTRLARVKSGEMFGEMAVIDDKPRSAGAVAFIDTTLITLTKENLHEFLSKNDKEITSKLLINIIKALSSRLRRVDDKLRNMNLYA